MSNRINRNQSQETKKTIAGLVLLAISVYTLYSYGTALFIFTPPVKADSYSSFPPIIAPGLPTPEEIENLSLEEAVELIDDLQTSEIAELIPELDPFLAGNIIAQLSRLKMIVIVEKAIENGEIDYVAEMVNNMPIEVAGDLLLSLEPDLTETLLELMANHDITEAARRLEEAVKQAEISGELNDFTAILEEMDVNILIDLLQEISLLPATPSTVATIFEAMSPESVIQILTNWINRQDFESLSMVIEVLSDTKLADYYLGLSPVPRNILFPRLGEITQDRLPNLGVFRVSELEINPENGTIGDNFNISAAVSNIGSDWGIYYAEVTLDGEVILEEKITISPSDTKTLSWLFTPIEARVYEVGFEDIRNTFIVVQNVQSLEPAEFTYSKFSIDPLVALPGDMTTVSVEIKNIGEETGSEIVELLVDDELFTTKLVTLAGGESELVVFRDVLVLDEPGVYVVKIGDLSLAYVIETEPVVSLRSNRLALILTFVVFLGYITGVYFISKNTDENKQDQDVGVLEKIQKRIDQLLKKISSSKEE